MAPRIFFSSWGRIGLIENGVERYLDPAVLGQVRWQVEEAFPGGRRWVLWSQEKPENPDADFGAIGSLAFAKTHLWLLNQEDGEVVEIKVPNFSRLSGIFRGGDRILTYCNDEGRMTLTESNPDGSDPEVVQTRRGYGYCVKISSDGVHAAYQITGVEGHNPYEIYVVNLRTGEEVRLASHPDYINFGPEWSPDGEWVLYQRCEYKADPGHERSDLRISRVDASEHRMLTSGQSHWFATSYGTPETRGGGSNIPKWSPDGKAITFTRFIPGSRTAWRYRVGQPDRDHFNRDYRPGEARGGTEICLISPSTGDVTPTKQHDPPVWNWRTEWSEDSRHLLFSRAAVGFPSEVWVIDLGGAEEHFLTRGYESLGADFARFVLQRVNF